MPKRPNQRKNTEVSEGFSLLTSSNQDSFATSYGKVVGSFEGIQRNQEKVVAAAGDNISTRSPFYPSDFSRQRPLDGIPRKFPDIIAACRSSYLRVGVIRNVIDLMTDFACDGFKIIHADKTVEAFFKVWIAKVKLKEAINEFVRHTLVDGNVVVKRTTATLTKPVENQWMSKTMASPDIKLYTENQNLETREIPWRYTFLNVAALEWLGDETDKILGIRKLAFKLSPKIVSIIKTPKDPFQAQIANSIPDYAKKDILNGRYVLDMDKIFVVHNKKDSWDDWAPPFLYAVLSDIKFKDKLRQAEIAAMDGWINVIRLWKLGDHAQKIFPTSGAVQRLIDILEANTGGGTVDLVWDSMIDMQEFYPPVEKILGVEKYAEVDKDILIGLGVPDVLLGGKGANFSNSYIQLKTLIEKLTYVREKIKEWIYNELFLVCQAMEIPVAPKITFGQMLDDEGTTRKLIVGLLDRGIISVEAVLQAYGQDFLIEIERMREENKVLKDAKVDIKGPFDQPAITPQAKPNNGRPPATKDSSPRKTRTPKVRTKGNLIFAFDIIDSFDKYILPCILENMKVSNARKLTSEQKDEINITRMIVLSSVKPNEDISEKGILKTSENTNNVDVNIINLIDEALSTFTSKSGNGITIDQRKRIEASIWDEYYSE